MQILFWERIPSLLMYGILFAGIIISFEDGILWLYRNKKRSKMLHTKEKRTYENFLFRHLQMVVSATFGDRVSLNSFLEFSGIIGLCSLLLFYDAAGSGVLFLGFLFASLPYFLLRLRLESLRYRGSNEAELLVSSLLNQYRSHYFNIFEGMEAVVREENPELKVTGNQLFRLLIALREAKNNREIRIATDRFAFSIKTNWCNMLSQCIYSAVSEGITITASLEDLMEQLKEARMLAEEKKRLNSESSRMVQILIPLAYLGSVFVGIKYLDIPLSSLIKNQIFTSGGLMLLSIILLLMVVNLILVSLVTKGKFDF